MSEAERETQGGSEPAGGASAAGAARTSDKTSLAERAAKPPASVAKAKAESPQPALAPPKMNRRSMLRLGFWTGLIAAAVGSLGAGLDLIYPRKITGFGGVITVGSVSDFPPGSKTEVTEGRVWLVHLTAEQGGPGLLALWWKCPHLGCTVPWKSNYAFKDPRTGQDKTGWFRCPCHGSTFDDAGIRVFGPAPRSMDTMKLTVDENGRITVDTGNITPGGEDNPSRAVPV